MEQEPATVTWVLLTLSALVAIAVSVVRRVPRGHRLVATRRGVVSRVAGPGVFVRVPGADRLLVEPAGPEDLPLVARATTRDGTDVRLLATARVHVAAPEPDLPYVDPRVAGGRAVEDVLAAWVRSHPVAELPDALRRRWPQLVAAAAEAARPHGLEVLDMETDELEALLLTPSADHGPD